jgi:hypothetical protein
MLSIPVAMAAHHAKKAKMESIEKKVQSQKVDGMSELKKGDAKLQELGDKEGEVTGQCCGSPDRSPKPKPKPKPDCEDGGTDVDCDSDSDTDPDRDTDQPDPSDADTETPSGN